MRPTVLLIPFVLACRGDTADSGKALDTDRAGPAISEAPGPDRVGTYAHRLPESPRMVVFAGDSITAGAGVSNADEDYASLLVNNAGPWEDWEGIDLATRYPGIDVVDISQGGAWTGTVLGDQIEDFEEQVVLPFEGEVLVVVTVGGNDLQSVLRDPSSVDERIEKTVDNWREIAGYFLDAERFPDGSTVLMANVYEPTDTVGQVRGCFYGLDISSLLPSLHDANTRLRGVAEEEGFSALDMRGTFLGHGFHHGDPATPYYDENDPSLWLANDCIHPNPRGHHEIRAMFWRAIAGDPRRP